MTSHTERKSVFPIFMVGITTPVTPKVTRCKNLFSLRLVPETCAVRFVWKLTEKRLMAAVAAAAVTTPATTDDEQIQKSKKLLQKNLHAFSSILYVSSTYI